MYSRPAALIACSLCGSMASPGARARARASPLRPLWKPLKSNPSGSFPGCRSQSRIGIPRARFRGVGPQGEILKPRQIAPGLDFERPVALVLPWLPRGLGFGPSLHPSDPFGGALNRIPRARFQGRSSNRVKPRQTASNRVKIAPIFNASGYATRPPEELSRRRPPKS